MAREMIGLFLGSGLALSGVAKAQVCDVQADPRCLDDRHNGGWIWKQTFVGGDSFGTALVIDGSFGVVGDAGARLGEREAAGRLVPLRRGADGAWVEAPALILPDAATGDFFGFSVAMSGDTLAAGGTGRAGGFVALYARADELLEPAGMLPGPLGAAGSFGWSVALEGDTLVVGSPHVLANGRRGRVHVYRRAAPGAPWEPTALLEGSETGPASEFGHVVAVAGGEVWVGDPSDPLASAGAAYRFGPDQALGGAWRERQVVRAPDGHPGQHFALSLAAGPGLIVAGAPQDQEHAYSGAVYVFTAARDGDFALAQKVPSPERWQDAGFGRAVAFDRAGPGRRWIAASGFGNPEYVPGPAVYVLEPGEDAPFVERGRMYHPRIPAQWGRTVAISGDDALVGGAEGLVTVYRRESPCDPEPCLNEGHCRPLYRAWSFECDCPDDYGGPRCDEPICSPPCGQGGRCVEAGGCGRSCVCDGGFRPPTCESRCGDGVCQAAEGEACETCPQDCPPCAICGDGACRPEVGEDTASCPSDCPPPEPCGDNVCMTGAGESAATCPDDCPVGVCGNGLCEGLELLSCSIDCDGRCGDGRCDRMENCGSCAHDCGPCHFCGDGECGADEDCAGCEADCGPCAGGCACPAGTFEVQGGCATCPPGRFSAAAGQAECVDCAPGAIAPREGSTECDPCPPDTYAGPDATRCIDCPAGTTSPAGSAGPESCVESIGAPSAPGLTLVTAGSDSVELRLTAPETDGGSPIVGYRWSLEIAGATVRQGLSAGLDFRVDALGPDTAYRLTVVALNAAGRAGPASAPVDFRTLAAGPVLVSLTADDPDDGDSIYSAGDTLSLRFDVPTTTPGAPGRLVRAAVDARFAFSEPPGEDYDGVWVAPDELRVTVITPGPTPPVIGRMIASVRPNGDIYRADRPSAPASGAAPPLAGDWGRPADPVFVVPGEVVGDEDARYAVPGLAVEGGPDPLSLTLDVAAGATLVVTPVAGILAPEGPEGAHLALSGDRAAINATLATLRYQGARNANGPAQIRLASGEARATVPLMVRPVNDQPVLLGLGPRAFPWPWVSTLPGLAVADPDLPDGDGEVLVTLAAAHGAFLVQGAQRPDVVVSAPAGVEVEAITLRGSMAAVNQTLGTLQVRLSPAGDCPAAALFVTVDDLGRVGGGNLVAAAEVPLAGRPCDAGDQACPDGSPVRVRLEDDLETMGVTFGAPMEGAEGRVDCPEIFDGPTLGRLGLAPECSWRDAYTLDVRLGAEAAVVPNEPIGLIPGALAPVCSVGVTVPPGPYDLAPPLAPPTPRARVQGAQDGTACPGAMAVLTAAALDAGPGSTLAWVPPAALADAGLDLANPTLQVPLARLPAGEHRFAVVVTTAWGTSSAPAIHTLRVVAPAFSVAIEGDDPLFATAGRALELHARAHLACPSLPLDLRYAWSLSGHPDAFPAGVGASPRVPENVLRPGRFTLTVQVASPALPGRVARDATTLVVGQGLALGAPCFMDAECESGFCADPGLAGPGEPAPGICCDRRCSGGCMTCRGMAPGHCEALPLGTSHVDCAPYLCDGIGRCASVCGTHQDCAAGFFCENTICKPKRAPGESCGDDAFCLRPGEEPPSAVPGWCVDGVCCEHACEGDCEQCERGLCAAIAAGEPPRSEGACGTAACNGEGGCAPECVEDADCGESARCVEGRCSAGASGGADCVRPTDCASQVCEQGRCTSEPCPAPCTRVAGEDAAEPGACEPLARGETAEGACGDYACDGQGACLLACETREDCAQAPEGRFCSPDAECVSPRAEGEACNAHLECARGVCVGASDGGVVGVCDATRGKTDSGKESFCALTGAPGRNGAPPWPAAWALLWAVYGQLRRSWRGRSRGRTAAGRIEATKDDRPVAPAARLGKSRTDRDTAGRSVRRRDV